VKKTQKKEKEKLYLNVVASEAKKRKTKTNL
jgi:urease gamma subunit